MNNIRYIVCFFGLLIGFPAFGYVNHEERLPEIFYCPATIECTANSIEYCHYDKKEYIESSGAPGIVKGIYYFIGAYSHYRYPHTWDVESARCQYKKGGSVFYLQYKAGADLEAYKNTPSKWDNHADPSHCLTTDTLQCPLLSKPELVIYRRKDISPSIKFLSIKTIANGISIKKSSGHYHYVTINYDEAFIACQGLKQCSIEIYYSFIDDNGQNHPYYYSAGSVVVDMLNNMHIVEIKTGPSHGSNGMYLLKREEPLNEIKFVP